MIARLLPLHLWNGYAFSRILRFRALSVHFSQQFKINQVGLVSGTLTSGTWGMGQLVANNNSWTTSIPSSLAAGNYILRHELLAIHTSNQPQFYPECAQLIVTGGGGATPSASYLVKLPGAYSMYVHPNRCLRMYIHFRRLRTGLTLVSTLIFTPTRRRRTTLSQDLLSGKDEGNVRAAEVSERVNDFLFVL